MTSIAQIERVYAARHRTQPYIPTGLIIQCAWCKKIKVGKTQWAYVPVTYGRSVSHGCCPECYEKVNKEGRK